MRPALGEYGRNRIGGPQGGFFHSKRVRRLHLQTFKELRAIFRPPRKRTEVLAVRHPSNHFLRGELARLTFDLTALYGFSWQTLQVGRPGLTAGGLPCNPGLRVSDGKGHHHGVAACISFCGTRGVQEGTRSAQNPGGPWALVLLAGEEGAAFFRLLRSGM